MIESIFDIDVKILYVADLLFICWLLSPYSPHDNIVHASRYYNCVPTARLIT
jgi:hypothetical protein